VVALGFMGCFFGWASFRAARKMGASILIAGCIGGLIGDIMVYATSGFILGTTLTMAPAAQYSLTGYLLVIYSAYLPTQLPIAVGEMLITGFALSYAYKQRPEVLESFGVVKKQPVSPAVSRVVLLAVIVFLSALICLTPKTAVSADEAASAPVAETAGEASAFSGMDEAVNENLAETAGLPPRAPYIDTESMGDLWNAIMLLAGGICGFVLGRWSHIIWGSGKRDENPKYMSPRENIHEYQT
jgi:cobalt/nickel transport system permease protein